MAKLPGADLEPTYRACAQWVERGLASDDSLFTPGRPIWSEPVLADLHRRFVKSPDTSSASFVDKLRGQLRDAPAATIQLAGEVTFVHFLVAMNIKGKTKRNLIHQVLSWSTDPPAVPPELAEAMEAGLANAGTAFLTYRPHQLWLIIEFGLKWKRLTLQEREQALRDPWAFKELVFSIPVTASQSQKHALLHLAHPDAFEAIVSQDHKRKIAEGFQELVDDAEEDVDRQIAGIREALRAQEEDFESFYRPGIVERWLRGKDPDPVDPPPPRGAVDFARVYPDQAARTAILSAFADSIELAHRQGERVWETSLLPRAIRLNVGQMQVFVLHEGEVLLVVDGRSVDLAALRATFRIRERHYRSSPDAVDVYIPAAEAVGALERFRDAHRAVVEGAAAGFQQTPYLRHHAPVVIEQLGRELGRTLPQPVVAPVAPRSLGELEEELFLDEGALVAIEKLLRDRRQIVLHGPPGTGKTFVAQRLAEHLAGDQGSVDLVQFHPSYAYEDFVEGFRPVISDGGQPGFRLADGPLKRIAARARSAPDATHVLIIDELNRGNLAKVFGELYFLLEYRSREITLQYSAAPFALPANLWIIATMNTADRSIALVDLALRRRFHFVEFHPDEAPIRGVLRAWLRSHVGESMLWVADVVDRANAMLRDRHVRIGPSYFLRKDLDEDWVVLLWQHSILPLLQEHFFGTQDELGRFDLAVLREGLEGGAGASREP